jgi:predicted DNA-binding transcriptional regulator AlpA
MIELKLPKLPDRTSTETTIEMLPELAGALQQYANVYEQVYGTREAVSDLIPYMLSAFIKSDGGFAQMAKGTTRTRSVDAATSSDREFLAVEEFARIARVSRRTIDRYRRDRAVGFPKEYDLSRAASF